MSFQEDKEKLVKDGWFGSVMAVCAGWRRNGGGEPVGCLEFEIRAALCRWHGIRHGRTNLPRWRRFWRESFWPGMFGVRLHQASQTILGAFFVVGKAIGRATPANAGAIAELRAGSLASVAGQ